MIDATTRKMIKDGTLEFWVGRAKHGDKFRDLLTADVKETGHSIADYVDSQTIANLKDATAFPGLELAAETDAKGKPRKRSMGDLWIKSNGIYNPVNIKAGIFGKGGQPNIVSLNKVLDALMKNEIDSYDILVVKMSVLVSDGRASVSPHVYFVDVLDYLDYIKFDAGPGQLMLNENSFYRALDDRVTVSELDVATKVSRLAQLLEDGHRRLLMNRERQLARKLVAAKDFTPSQVNQEGLSLNVSS